MKSNDEMARNRKLLKECNRAYNTVTTIYAVICAFYAGVILFGMFLGTVNSQLLAFLDGVVFKGALFFCGLMACYKHDTKFTLFAMVIALINTFLNDCINSPVFIITIILSVVTAVANKKYHYLENQFGFPYFSERFEEQNMNTRQREIKDEYQQNYEKYMKTSSSDMTDINSAVRTVDLTKKEDTVRTGTMDDVMENYNE